MGGLAEFITHKPVSRKPLTAANGIRKLAYSPEIGLKRDQVRDGYRVLFIGSRAVHHKVTPDTVDIIRVLPGTKDPDGHLE